jgi:hypothetical protein
MFPDHIYRPLYSFHFQSSMLEGMDETATPSSTLYHLVDLLLGILPLPPTNPPDDPHIRR